MGKENRKSQSSQTAKTASIILAVIDVLLAAILIFGFVITPIQGDALKADLPEDFVENAEDYWQSNNTKEYTSAVSVSYESVAKTPVITKASTEEEGEQGMYAGFVFPDSNKTALSDNDIQNKVTDQETCRRAINEIYARHGYAFTRQENIDYFNQYDWYKNMTKEADMNKVSSQFSAAEKQNVEKLQAYENSKGWG